MINFFRDLFGLSIRSKVMKVINQRINVVEKLYRENMTQAYDVWTDEVGEAKDRYEDAKEMITEKHVDMILNKII